MMNHHLAVCRRVVTALPVSHSANQPSCATAASGPEGGGGRGGGGGGGGGGGDDDVITPLPINVATLI